MSPRSTAVRRPARTPVADIDKAIHEFLYNRSIAKNAGKLRDKARDTLKPWFASGAGGRATVNDNGSQEVEFEAPLLIDGVKYTGLENVRKESSALDLDLVDDLLDTLGKDVRSRVVKKVVDYVVDPDELFKLNQEGVITDEQLDALFTVDVTWALGVKQA
jgi:hypothetical protein